MTALVQSIIRVRPALPLSEQLGHGDKQQSPLLLGGCTDMLTNGTNNSFYFLLKFSIRF